MALRYFSATAYAGRLYLQGVPDRGPWEVRQLVYWEEAQVDAILNPRVGDRKVQTPENLRAAVDASRLWHPAMKVWIEEGLEEAARAIWKETAKGMRPAPAKARPSHAGTRRD